MLRGLLIAGHIPALAAGVLEAGGGEPEAHATNDMCWYNTENTPEQCCGNEQYGQENCWRGLWYVKDFCCHALPGGYQKCYDDIEERVMSKLHTLAAWEADVSAHSLEQREGEALVIARAMHMYQNLLAHPVQLWAMACNFPDSPLLWSEGCACCDPPELGCVRDNPAAAMRQEYWQCCYPIYARKVLEAPDEKLEASIEAHLGALSVQRAQVTARGPALVAALTEARGCVISIRGGQASSCDEAHACPWFDCSYLRALKLTLTIIQHINPLPDLDFVLSAGDLVMDAHGEVPVFTRTGTMWTTTVALPFEWQLHPQQCLKHVKAGMAVAEEWPWEARIPRLIWRGSNSNCRVNGCEIARAEAGTAGMEACGRLLGGELRDCTWNSTTWLQMPRGRLVWLSRFFPQVDAKLTRSRYLPLDPELDDFLQSEGLIAEPMPVERQGRYKYAIAVEGDSAADRIYWQLFTGAVLLIPDGPWQVFSVRDMLEPYVHYVPVRYDLGDLVEKVLWLQQHDAEAKAIARNGMDFAQRYLTCEGVVHYVDRLLRAYARRLRD